MLIYEKLPKDNPSNQPEAGRYFAVIMSAEIRESQSTFKPYLNVQYFLYDKDGKYKGNMYDIFTESPSSIPQYKIKRFVDAIEMKVSGDFCLDDMAENALGKAIILDARLRKDADPPRLEADVFKAEVYYPISSSMETMGVEAPKAVLDVVEEKNEIGGIEVLNDPDMPF